MNSTAVLWQKNVYDKFGQMRFFILSYTEFFGEFFYLILVIIFLNLVLKMMFNLKRICIWLIIMLYAYDKKTYIIFLMIKKRISRYTFFYRKTLWHLDCMYVFLSLKTIILIFARSTKTPAVIFHLQMTRTTIK